LIVVELLSANVAGEKIALTAIAKLGKATLSSANANVTGNLGGATKVAATVGAAKKHHDINSFSRSLCLSISVYLCISVAHSACVSISLYLTIYLSIFLGLAISLSSTFLSLLSASFLPFSPSVSLSFSCALFPSTYLSIY